jgi:hypothetical protein
MEFGLWSVNLSLQPQFEPEIVYFTHLNLYHVIRRQKNNLQTISWIGSDIILNG